MNKLYNALGFIGNTIVRTGTATGREIAKAYNSVDRDLMRSLAQLPLLSYSLFVSKREPFQPLIPDGFLPLVFVHGIGGNRGNFLPMSIYLSLLGRKRSYKIQFQPEQRIDDMVAGLAAFISKVKDITAEEKIEIIAHSFGGIISRLAIDKYKLQDSVETLITMGSPHGGTYSARFANTYLTNEIRPDSDFIARLKQLPWPGGVRGFTLWSRNDLMILPADSAVVTGAEHIDMSPFTHYSYLIEPKGWATVARCLSGKIVEPLPQE